MEERKKEEKKEEKEAVRSRIFQGKNLIQDEQLEEIGKKNIRAVDFSGGSLGVSQLQKLVEFFHGGSLRRVTLYQLSEPIADRGATIIADALREPECTLEHLEIDSGKITDKGAKALADALKGGTKLTTLILSRNLIKGSGASAIANALESSKTIEKLSFYENKIGDAGMEACAKLLKSKAKLTELVLYGAYATAEGLAHLKNALKENKTLKSLDLGQCHNMDAEKLKDVGKVLAEIVGVCHLETLDLRWNDLDEAAEPIPEQLKQNKSLTKLNLQGNWIKDTTVAAIVDSLSARPGKMSLHLSYNDIDEKAALALVNQQKLNKVKLKESVMTTLAFQKLSQHDPKGEKFQLPNEDSLKKDSKGEPADKKVEPTDDKKIEHTDNKKSEHTDKKEETRPEEETQEAAVAAEEDDEENENRTRKESPSLTSTPSTRIKGGVTHQNGLRNPRSPMDKAKGKTSNSSLPSSSSSTKKRGKNRQ